MNLGTPNALPKFKCKNLTIKNSASEKLLGVIIDKKLDFTEHLIQYEKGKPEVPYLNSSPDF